MEPLGPPRMFSIYERGLVFLDEQCVAVAQVSGLDIYIFNPHAVEELGFFGKGPLARVFKTSIVAAAAQIVVLTVY